MRRGVTMVSHRHHMPHVVDWYPGIWKNIYIASIINCLGLGPKTYMRLSQVDNNTTNRKLGMQTRHVADSQYSKTNRDLQAKPDADNVSKPKMNIPSYLYSSTSKTNMPDYFSSSDNKEADKRGSEAITNRIHDVFNYLFSAMHCFSSTFFLQVKKDSYPYQAPPRRVGNVLQKPLKEQLK